MKHKFEGLEPEIDVNRSSSDVDLSMLSTEPCGIPIIFVLGCPRSGTTLVGNVFGANRQAASGDESLFLLDEWNKFDRYVLGNNRRGAANLSSFSSPQRILGYTSEYLKNLYGDLRDAQDARYAVDHTPVYGHVQEFIDLMVPDATYVHVVRNMSDVVSSLRSVKEAGAKCGQSTDEARRAFHDHWVDLSRSIGERVVDRYFEITYEEFCSRPEDTLAPVLNQLELDWSQSMADAMNIRYAQNAHSATR